MSKLTPWFYDENPVRAGVYLSTVTKGVDFYRYWDGENWYYGDFTPQLAMRIYKKGARVWPTRSPSTRLHWRGLAEEPGEKGHKMIATPPAPTVAPSYSEEQLRKAMRRSFNFGQTYWQQADSDYVSQHKKSDETVCKFNKSMDDECAILAAATREQK